MYPSLEAVLLIFVIVSILIFVLFWYFFSLSFFPALTLSLIFGYILFVWMYPFNYLRYQDSAWVIAIYLFFVFAIPLYLLLYLIVVSMLRIPLNSPTTETQKEYLSSILNNRIFRIRCRKSKDKKEE
jgi:hypothetical protein